MTVWSIVISISFFLVFSNFDYHFDYVDCVSILIDFSIVDGNFDFGSGGVDCASDFEYGYGDVVVI